MANATTPPRRCARCSKSLNAPCNNTVMTALFRLSPCRVRCSTESPTCVPHWRKTMLLHSPTATPRTSLRSTADDNRFVKKSTEGYKLLGRFLLFYIDCIGAIYHTHLLYMINVLFIYKIYCTFGLLCIYLQKKINIRHYGKVRETLKI